MLPMRNLVPFGYYQPGQIFNHSFDSGLRDIDIHVPPSFGHLHHHFPLHLLQHKRTGVSEIICTKDLFQIRLDVQHFSPDELSVRAEGRNVVIEGKHEEKEDKHGYVTRSFTRRYLLPSDINAEDFDDKVACEMSSDGVLSISIPRPAPPPVADGGKTLPIKPTGQPAVRVA